MFKSNERIANIEMQIGKLRSELSTVRLRAKSFFQHGKKHASELDAYYRNLLQENFIHTCTYISSQPPQEVAGWDNKAWQSWDAEKTGEKKNIRIGDLVENQTEFSVPCYTPFIGEKRTIIIRSNSANAAQSLALLQSLVMRTAMMLPHQSYYTLLDPAGSSIAFPMRRHLPHIRPGSNDIRRDLDGVQDDIKRIIETYLDAATTSFELIPDEIRVNERFQFVFAADFPNQYDRRAIEALQSVANTGMVAGVYVFIHQNLQYELPRDLTMDGFKNACYIDLDANSVANTYRLTFKPDNAPPPDLQSRLGEALRLAKPPERILDWDKIVGLDENNWWQESAAQLIETPIGARSGNERLNVWFGVKREQPCAHGMLGAMTGSGKSNLYHVLINGLASRYSPAELHFYLIDGKDGVEFQQYRHLPHAEVVSLRSSPELSRSVLVELVEEKERRNTLFSRAKVANFSEYREKGQPSGNLPRILLLIDEYQELFEGDRDGIASNNLRQVAEQGRSAGIHMLLASQHFGAAGMLQQTYIFGNTHLRMAMKMTEADVQALTEFGRRGKALISTCDLPGKIVLNDRGGDDTINYTGKVAYLPGERRNTLLGRFNVMASSLPKAVLPRTVVFNGQAQPLLLDNPEFVSLLNVPTWTTAQALEQVARQPHAEGGFEIADWFFAEHPYIAWLGQEFSVRGQAKMILRRRIAENVMVIGGINPARYGMLAAILASLSVNANPAASQFVIVDRCIPGTQWSNILRTVTDSLLSPAGYSAYFTDDGNLIEPVLDDLLLELGQRQSLNETALITRPALFVMMTELDRVDRLRRKADTYGLTESPLGEKLQRLLVEGPSVGMHTILSFSGVRPMTYVVDERHGLSHFRHRIALQMSEDESFTLVRSKKATQLQLEGAMPISALYLDMDLDRAVRFKPYSTSLDTSSNDDIFMKQMQVIGKILSARSKQP